MKRTNKKGFTTVELVIVIAVIAILAAVLIPTFANLIRKANISADTQLAKNLNTALAMDTAENGKPSGFGDVLDALYENGFVLANMNPTTDGCYFVWEEDENQIMLVEIDGTEPKVLYSPKDAGEPDATWHVAVKNQRIADTVEAALPNVTIEMTILNTTDLNNEINNEINNGKTHYIDGSIVVDDNNTIKLNNPSVTTTIDLGSNKVTGGSNDTSAEAFPFYVTAGTLNLKNGVISATGALVDSDGEAFSSASAVWSEGNSELNIEGTKLDIQTNSTYTIVYGDGAKGTMKDVVINTPSSSSVIYTSGDSTGSVRSELRLENCTLNAKSNGICATYGGQVTIDGGTYHTSTSNLFWIYNYNASITVKDGIFTCGNAAKTFKFYNFTGSKIVLEGGTFNGIAFENLTESAIRGMCDLTNCAKDVNVVKTADAWTITVK